MTFFWVCYKDVNFMEMDCFLLAAEERDAYNIEWYGLGKESCQRRVIG